MTKDLINRISFYLASGGLFNPELADHIAVRTLLFECREALAQQDSKDKEQAKTDSFVRQLDKALAQPEPWEKFCDSNCVWTDHHPDCKLAQRKPLTDEDLRKLADKHLFYQPEGYEVSGVFAFAGAIEAAHGIKGEA